MNFEQMKRNALTEWNELENSDAPRIYLGYATCGCSAGAIEVEDAIRAELKKKNIAAKIVKVGCIGICYLEPLVDIAKKGRPRICYGRLTPKDIPKLLEDYLINDNPRADLALGTLGNGNIEGINNLFELPMLKPQVRVILRNCGMIDPENINHYIANGGGYSGLARALGMKPEEIIAEIKKSGLRGRGGAGFSTGTKWQFCRDAPGTEKYIICNADEGDPGAFMNRSLLEGDPHSVLEGMVIGAYAIGATHGYLYVRAEYPLAIVRLNIALEQMRKHNLLGDNILGSGFSFDLTIKEGAGAFVCGEETAMIASIQGQRGMPNPRPPFPATSGLWGKPTNINNVETWASAAAILQKGWDVFAKHGTEKSKGTKTFSLVGKVARTGLIEVPLGMALRRIIYDIGGGILDNKEFKGVQTGGPSGGCLPATALDIPIDYEHLTEAGSIMGSGGMIVLDSDTCMVDLAKYFLSFTKNESCGKCVFCREGTSQMYEILKDISEGKGKHDNIELLSELGMAIKDGSLCALGGTAPNPVLTTIRYFKNEYEAHIKEGRCPAKVCKALIAFYIDPAKCIGCQACAKKCSVKAISGDRKMVHVIDQSKCIKCGNCIDACPVKVGAVKKVGNKKEIPKVPEKPIPIGSWSK